MKNAVLHFIGPHVIGCARRNVNIARIKDHVSITEAGSTNARDYPGWVGLVRGAGSGGNIWNRLNHNPFWGYGCCARNRRNETFTGNRPGIAVRIGWFILKRTVGCPEIGPLRRSFCLCLTPFCCSESLKICISHARLIYKRRRVSPHLGSRSTRGKEQGCSNSEGGRQYSSSVFHLYRPPALSIEQLQNWL